MWQMNTSPLLMMDVSDTLDQMRQHQLLTQQSAATAHYQPLNNISSSSADLYGNIATSPSAQSFNGSLSKLMISDEG